MSINPTLDYLAYNIAYDWIEEGPEFLSISEEAFEQNITDEKDLQWVYEKVREHLVRVLENF